MPPATQLATTDAKPNKGGAPLGNRNGMRHGLRGSGLPKGCHHIERATSHFRRQVEDAVVEARGEISLLDAAFINSAYRAERHAQLAQRWLAKEAENMTPADRLAYSREVAKASKMRDEALAALGLPQRPSTAPWATLPALNVITSDVASAPTEGSSDG
jgi:hypothetical protein